MAFCHSFGRIRIGSAVTCAAMALVLAGAPGVSLAGIGLSGDVQSVGGAVSNHWNIPGYLTIGYQNDGSLSIDKGSSVTDQDGYLGWGTNTTGTAVIEDLDSKWTNTASLSVGYQGTGSMQISNGGLVNSYALTVAEKAGATGDITVDGGQTTLIVSNYMNVGQGGVGKVTVSNGASFTSSGTVNIGLTDRFTPSSTVVVQGTGTTFSADSVVLGISGDASMTIRDGAKVYSKTGMFDPNDGNASGPMSIVSVESGSSWLVADTLTVGESGSYYPDIKKRVIARLHITGGSQVSSTNAAVGHIYGAYGQVEVDGAGSLWQVGASLHMGTNDSIDPGQALLTIHDGGTVSVTSAVSLGALATINLQQGGTLKAEQINATLGQFNFTGGRLELITYRGHLLNQGGVFAPGHSPAIAYVDSYTQQPAGALEIELGGLDPGGNYDRLVVRGDLALAGTLTVRLINGFDPAIGDIFKVLSWNTLRGAFDQLTLPTLGIGRQWDTSRLYQTGTLAVTPVPEPTSAALMLLGAGALLSLRRRRAAGETLQSSPHGSRNRRST